jgi:hypothetical protein
MATHPSSSLPPVEHKNERFNVMEGGRYREREGEREIERVAEW